MKNYTWLLFIVILHLPKTNWAQCNYNDKSPVSIGQIIADTAFCPSGGKLTIANVTGGGGNYVYEILSGPVIRIIQSQPVFNALPYGSYRIRVSSCTGLFKDTTVNIINRYSSISISNWQQAIQKISGLVCGVTNDGVYKIAKPVYPGGTPPYRIQVSTSLDFTAVPFQPGNDSAIITGLNASTAYYVRITDACNNFQTTNFSTPAATPVAPLSVPALSFTRAMWMGSCSGNETIGIYINDSASGGPYNVTNAYSNQVFWGHKNDPYLRIKIEDAVNGTIYSDRNLSLYKSGNVYYFQTNYSLNGETGLNAPGTGFTLYTPSSFNGVPTPPNTMPMLLASNEFPPNAPLKITLFYPGGDHCGTTIQPYSKTFNYALGTHGTTAPIITAINPNCSGLNPFLRVDFNTNYIYGKITLVKPAPVYSILTSSTLYTGANTYTTINYNPLIPGQTYRVIVEDTCGRKDSMSVVYNPGYAAVPPPVISDSSLAGYKCPVNPADTMYSILLKPLPAGYNLVNVSIQGYGIVGTTAISNWNGTGQTAYKLNQLLPPGTYTYTVGWLNTCVTGTVTQNIVIPPVTDPALYSANMVLSAVSSTAACNVNGYSAIQIDGYIKNINTSYTISNLRLVGVPNNYVFPITQIIGTMANGLQSSLYFNRITSGDSIKINSGYSGIIINTGQSGTYTFAMDIVCSNGTLVETITKNYTISAAPYIPYFPVLKYANALICDGGGTEAKINMLPQGGIRPFHYEYKPESSLTYIATGNSGTDSVVVITPAPTAGTIYDIRVVDACGMTATSKVSTASFTGNFYVYAYPPDCKNHPFDVRIGTASINGAYYKWKRNGLLIAEGFNLTSTTITGVSLDTITVEVNMFDCYTRSATRVITFTNPCNISVLPVTLLNFTGVRINEYKVQLSWKSKNETGMQYYEVEKSADGIAFKTTGRVNASNLLQENDYEFMDTETSPQMYYRLKITDFNGRITYTNVQLIKNKVTVKTTLKVGASFSKDDITLFIITADRKPFVAMVYNDKGQLMKNIAIAADDIAGGKRIDINTWAAGVYYITLYSNNEVVTTTKFLKF